MPTEKLVVLLIAIALGLNFVVAFAVSVYFQTRVIFKISRESKQSPLALGYTGINDPNSPQANFMRFLSGELDPALRRKWFRALLYMMVSFASLFAFMGIINLIDPRML